MTLVVGLWQAWMLRQQNDRKDGSDGIGGKYFSLDISMPCCSGRLCKGLTNEPLEDAMVQCPPA